MRKQMAGALVASMLMGSVPAWAEGEKAASAAKSTLEEQAQRQQFRDSIDRAVDGVTEGIPASETTAVVLPEPGAPGPELTSQERRDLDMRRAALRTDPVARGAGSIVMMLVGTVASIGLTAYLVKQAQKTDPTPSLGRH